MVRRAPLAGFCTAVLTLLLTACIGPANTEWTAQEVPEIHPGMLQGYLPMEERLKSIEFVPLAPDPDSAQQRLDEAVSQQALALRDTPRWELAIQDAQLIFPEAASTFSCALGLSINEQDTPALYMLMRRTLTDIGLATYSAKNAYQRPRPFILNDEPFCTPEQEEILRNDGSYPSGHTAIGWGWALILAELVPERAEALLARGRAFGESRLVCNVHWYSDVVAGRMVAAGAVALLHANDEFNATLRVADAEIQRALALEREPDPDCAAEQQVLSSGLL